MTIRELLGKLDKCPIDGSVVIEGKGFTRQIDKRVSKTTGKIIYVANEAHNFNDEIDAAVWGIKGVCK